ncbi:MAG TPA: PGPGW domain-containing protein [Aeromicrobium sp.]|nr:PGPGW domain-containing protein [Aeromicrobium sp.]
MSRWFRRIGSEVLGWTLVVLGLVLTAPGVPGPGLLLLVAGLALLAPHYAWARRAFEPLHDRAVEAAQRGVSTKARVLVGVASVLWLVGLGVVWLLSPPIPEFSLMGWEVGPRLPGGRAAGIGMFASGVAGGALLAYSVKRWYPGSEASDR